MKRGSPIEKTIQLDEDSKQLFTALYKDMQKTWRREASLVIKDQFLIEDTIHNAFQKIIPFLPYLRAADKGGRVRYIKKVIHSVAIDTLRKNGRELPISNEDLDLEPGHHDIIECTENTMLFYDILRKLSEKDQRLILYRDIYSRSYEQISIAENMDIPSLRVAVSRARHRFFEKGREVMDREQIPR